MTRHFSLSGWGIGNIGSNRISLCGLSLVLLLTGLAGCGGSSSGGDSSSGIIVSPIADIGGPYSVAVGATVTLDGSASSDADGSIVSFAWDLDNDGAYDDAVDYIAQFHADSAGTFTVSLQVTDDQGLTDTDSTTVTVTVTGASAITFPIVDTGQVTCYDSNGTEQTCTGTGYDADYTGSAPSYTLSGDGTRVTDNVTGLVWTQTPDRDGDGDVDAADKLTQPDAVNYCAALNLGGQTWRLPSVKELYSLILFSGGDPSGYSGTDTSTLTPFIDGVFEPGFGDTGAGDRIIDGQYATTTLYVSPEGTLSSAATMFGVNFIDGRIKGYPYDFPSSDPKTFYVLCVSGSEAYGVNAFHDNGNGTVSDDATGLMWEQDDTSGLNFEEAVAQCEAATTGGWTDWRLPNVKELQGIVDYDRAPDATGSAAIDAVFNATSFTNEGGAADWGYYWSSTTHANYLGGGSSGAYVSFGRALGYYESAIVDVHGAGAQRSNHKTDVSLDPINSLANAGYGSFYYGGPQGDIARHDNRVRCVRADDET